jgi:hypothetical protein
LNDFDFVPKNVLATNIALRYNISIKAMTENNACFKRPSQREDGHRLKAVRKARRKFTPELPRLNHQRAADFQ